jgi:hypothetical protein
MRYARPAIRYLLVGVAQCAGVIWIVAYARQDDSYYYPTEVSHWEHASRGGGASAAVVAAVVASGVALAFLLQGLMPGRRIVRRSPVLAAVLYVLFLYGSFFWLAMGH